VVLCDDVLYTGRTIRAALDGSSITAPGAAYNWSCSSTAATRTAIEATYVGRHVPTSSREIIE